MPSKKSQQNQSFSGKLVGIQDHQKFRKTQKAKKVFIISKAYGCIKQALLDRNWTENKEMSSPLFNLKFVVRYIDINFKNIKKGQFLAPESMQFAVNKVKESGNNKIWLTDRGSMFGYQDMVVDFRGIPKMKEFAPTIMDITHSLQQPNQSSGVTGGPPEMIETIAKAAIAVGADGLFIETHPNPSEAKSDGANMLNINKMSDLLTDLVRLRAAIR